jgi:hypothetical protein
MKCLSVDQDRERGFYWNPNHRIRGEHGSGFELGLGPLTFGRRPLVYGGVECSGKVKGRRPKLKGLLSAFDSISLS